MTGKLLFVHGTGVRDVSASVRNIKDGVEKVLGWGAEQVHAVEWGKAVGPQPLDIGPALPPEDTRGEGLEDEDPAALWDLLLADPYAELRILAEVPAPAMGGGDDLGLEEDLASVVLSARLKDLTLDDETLATAGLSRAAVNEARDELAEANMLAQAADRIGDPDDGDLVTATADALVAIALAPGVDLPAESEEPEPRALYDGAAREALVQAIEQQLSPTMGLGGALMRRIVGPIATRMAMRKRVTYMKPLSDFIRDVAFYIQRGEQVRGYLASELRQHGTGEPVVLLGHSLGGIAAVDLLADPTVMSGPDPLNVDLLVTVGSQAPYLYLLDALSSLSPRSPNRVQPFSPWLNIYNREDLLSFCAEGVFVNAAGVHDEPVDADVPFPMSHSAYWTVDRTYELIREQLRR
ncbi:hypothetical protein JD79_04394 [Geodermatophilus normandii]|uniref:Alpha/beta hydrolase n=1 Tax=Geodermatophilus normandii TaxID=1137989 RepID=A0A317QRD6_9ACTN|nr:hypothetical protein [Geodermatophilus normandii]PWW25196.1 hypothetical protein JD79_04394 [Geodermatophilus normandii]